MLVVAADDFHMLADLVEQAALLHPPLAPAGEIAFEPRLVLAAILVIVAVELAHVPLPPRMVVRVVLAKAFAAFGLAFAPAAAAPVIFTAVTARGRELHG